MLCAPFTPLQVAFLCIQSTEITITVIFWAAKLSDLQIELTGLSLKKNPFCSAFVVFMRVTELLVQKAQKS